MTLEQQLAPFNHLSFEILQHSCSQGSLNKSQGMTSVSRGNTEAPVGQIFFPMNVETSLSTLDRATESEASSSAGTPCSRAKPTANSEPQIPLTPCSSRRL